MMGKPFSALVKERGSPVSKLKAAMPHMSSLTLSAHYTGTQVLFGLLHNL